MARALQDGRRRAEPSATVSGSPAFPVGGTVALPPSVCRGAPLALPPGLNGVYSCRRGGRGSPRRRSSGAPGILPPPSPTRSPLGGEEPEAPQETEQGAASVTTTTAEPNGHLRGRPAPSLEQAIGACLRRMGDQFQQDYELREHRQLRGAFWGHFHHVVFHLLGILYNLPGRG